MDQQLEFKNYMEDLVQAKMPDVLKTMKDICLCDRCRLDILAHALNNSPPKYVVSPRGTMYAKLSVLQGQFEVDVVRAITDAAIIIGSNPRHGDGDS